MRRPLHGDVVAAARVLRRLDPAGRFWVLARMMREAERAWGHVVSGNGAHPLWGDGSLMTAALRRGPEREPSLQDCDYCCCLAMVFAALAEWKP